jgi:hypothetical protein
MKCGLKRLDWINMRLRTKFKRRMRETKPQAKFCFLPECQIYQVLEFRIKRKGIAKVVSHLYSLLGTDSRGGCKRCGMLGHLTFQCRNPVQRVLNNEESDNVNLSFDFYPLSTNPIVLVF